MPSEVFTVKIRGNGVLEACSTTAQDVGTRERTKTMQNAGSNASTLQVNPSIIECYKLKTTARNKATIFRIGAW